MGLNPFRRGFPRNKLPQHGFTLSELLIALGILGVIATFSITKILNANQDAKRKAIFREAISINAQILGEGVKTRALTPTNFSSFFLDRINFVKICPNSMTTQGCWNSAVQGTPTDHSEPGGILPNGAVMGGYNNLACGGTICGNGVVIDWNGTEPPNTVGEDQLNLNLCYGTDPCTPGMLAGTGPKGPGAVGPANSAANIALYAEIFEN